MRRPIFCSRGFTLLEILVAIVLAVLVLAGLFSGYRQTLEVTAAAEASRDLEQVARMVLAQLRADLVSAYYQEWDGEEKDSPYRFLGNPGEEQADGQTVLLEFATSSRLDLEAAAADQIVRVAYVLAGEGQGKGKMRLLRRQRPLPYLDLAAPQTVMELADNVEELQLAFVDSDGWETDTWDSASPEEKAALPKMIRIELQVGGESPEASRRFAALASPTLAGEGR